AWPCTRRRRAGSAGACDRGGTMWRYPNRVLAHRGGGTLAPENTLAGLRRGMQAGFRAIEYDVMLARDGIPVVLHDPWLGRMVAALFADEIAAGRTDRVPLLSSFSAVALDAARDAAPQLARACLMERLVPDWEARAQVHGAAALHLNHKHLTEPQARAVKAA